MLCITLALILLKRAYEVCFTNETGDVLDGNLFNIPNTISGIDKLQKKLNKFGLTPDNSIVGMEANGHYWLVLYSWLGVGDQAVANNHLALPLA